MKFLAPSILSADFSNLQQQIRYAEIGGADIIHCDVMDGKFVPNITFGPVVVASVKKITKLKIDVHLMICDPQNYIKQFADAGADYISVHYEEVKHLHRVIQQIKEAGIKAGVVLNPATTLSVLDEILPFVDFVLLMSVNPGFGGQSFIESTLNKIERLRRIRKERNLNFLIEVDGGINKKNIKNIAEAGCDIFIAGSAIFSKDNISAEVVEMKNIISNIE